MNKTLFTSVAEIKTLLGITGSDLDAALTLYLQAAVNKVCDLIGAHELISFEVTDEEVTAHCEDYLSPKHLPIDWEQTVTVKTSFSNPVTDTLFAQPGEIRTIRRKDSSGNYLAWSPGTIYLVSYTAGFADVASAPVELKMLAALIVQAQILKVDRSAMSKLAGNSTEVAGQIKKYQVGTKSVEYFDPNTKGGASGFGAGIDFEKTAAEWAARFKKFQGYA